MIDVGDGNAREPTEYDGMAAELIRLSKLMAQRGLCSRREADEFIAQGLVFVDGQRADQLGTKVFDNQVVTLDRAAQRTQQELATILLHKPVGYVSGQPEKGYRPAASLITPENQAPGTSSRRLRPQDLRGLAPAGRLDIDSRGLLVFTQDGRLAKLLTAEDSKLEKEYLVRFRGELDDQGLALLQHGLSLDGKPLKPAVVTRLGPDRLRFLLREGKHRQIRRMCAAVGLEVTSLQRVRTGAVRLGALPEGRWRFLDPREQFGKPESLK
jgi:23S rRNA pseudouridine2604 synthase